MDAEAVAQLVPLAAYGDQRRHIFPSQTSLDWFLRKHREGLTEAGALLLLTGRWFARPLEFDQYVLELGSRNARSHC